MKKAISIGLLCWLSTIGMVQAQGDFNPENPPEPMAQRIVYISADPAEGAASITQGGSFSIGRTISISVTPANGYRFLEWTLDDAPYATTQAISYTVTDNNVSFVAKLAKNPVITVSVSPQGAGSVSGGGSFVPGKKQRISTSAYSGYTLQYWTLNGEPYSEAGTNTSFYYTVGEEDAAFVAVYQANTQPDEPDPEEPFNPDSPPEPLASYPVSISTDLPDNIQPASIASGGLFPMGKMLSLFVSAPKGFAFEKWTINGYHYSNQPSCPYTVGDSAAVFVAHFSARYTVSLSVSPVGAGTTSGGGTYRASEKILVSTTPKKGWTFQYWNLDGERYADAASFYFIVGEKDVNFEAVYLPEGEEPENPDEPFNPDSPPEPMAEKEALTIRAEVNDAQLGYVTGLPTTPLFEGNEITLEAISKNPDGYYFVRWENGLTTNPRTITLTGDAVYIATFAKYQYKITFKDDDGTVLDERQWGYGETPTCISPAKQDDEQFTYRFIGWDPAVVAVTGEATYTAQYTSSAIISGPIVIGNGENENLEDITGVNPDITIEPGGDLYINTSGVGIGVLVIVADGVHSGEVHHHGHGVTAEHIYLEYILNPWGTTADPNKWYAFAVPFEVDIETGITRAYGSQSHISGTDFLIKEYDGTLRAETGKGWKSKLTGTLKPGHFYMIGIEGDCNRWRFEKKTGMPYEGDAHVSLSAFESGNTANAGWNSLGNTLLENAGLTSISLSDIKYIVTYDNQFGKYETKLISEIANLFVGQPFFIQTPGDGSFDFKRNSNNSTNMPALRASAQGITPLMHFTLADETQSTGIDHMFLTLHGDVDGTYTIGRDVARMTTNCTTAAQLWCTMPNGTELSAHGVAMPEPETIVPITLFAPTAGEYLLGMSCRAINGYEVELLHNGVWVATLSDALPTVLDLNAGNNSDYSLRISRRNIPTGIEDAQGDNAQSTKVIINDHLYILRAGHMYDAQGKQVK